MDTINNTINIEGYAHKVTLFDSYEDAATARWIELDENEEIEYSGVTCGYGGYIVWLAKADDVEFYL